MSEWVTQKISEVYEGLYDGPHATPPDSEDGAVFLGISNITPEGRLDFGDIKHISEHDLPKWTKRVEPRGGDIVFSYEATLNLYAIIPEGFWGCLGRRMALIRPNNSKAYGRFLYYYFFSPQWRSTVQENTVIGATVDRIPLVRFPDFPISIPDLQTQHRIADILSAYDALIENNQRQIKLLEEAAQRLYKEWFVDLRYPGHEKVPVVDGVPEGWKQKKVTDLLQIRYGKDHKSLADGNIPVYGSGGIMRKVKPILYSGESVLIPRKGSLNNILFVDGDFWTIDTMFYSIPQMGNVAKYCYLFLSRLDMYSFNIGAAVPSMTVNILEGIGILLPNEQVLSMFENRMKQIFDQKKLLVKQNEFASEARDRLLPKLMSGEIAF